jgi:hypothetical protein
MTSSVVRHVNLNRSISVQNCAISKSMNGNGIGPSNIFVEFFKSVSSKLNMQKTRDNSLIFLSSDVS